MSKAFRMVATMSAVIILVGCSTVQKDWKTAQTRDTIYSYDEFIQSHPHSEFRPQAESKIAELQKQKEGTSRRIAEKLRSMKIRQIAIDVEQPPTPRGLPFPLPSFDPSGPRRRIIAGLDQMGLFTSPKADGLILHVFINVSYYFRGPWIYGTGVPPDVDLIPSVRNILEDGEVTYNLNDCQDPLAERLADVVKKAVKN
ncbi:MAG: hypothetical protein NTX01_01460 [Candidatus Omnitrophica bacterium]|nr:hypothetical protein [Candidatus Omnitrophota bacterium]